MIRDISDMQQSKNFVIRDHSNQDIISIPKGFGRVSYSGWGALEFPPPSLNSPSENLKICIVSYSKQNL